MKIFQIANLLLTASFVHACATTGGESASSAKNAPVYFDLTASVVPSADTMAMLKDKGFTVIEEITYHPGQQACQFIYIAKPFPKIVLLELCHVDSSRPKDEKFGLPDPSDRWQEYKFSVNGKLEDYFEREKSNWAELRPRMIHKNYEWQRKEERLPGWNFLEFGNDPIPGAGLFFVEREPDPKNPPKDIAGKREIFALRYHPNYAQLYLGAIFELKDPQQRTAFERVSKAERRGDCSILSDGTWVQWVKPDSDLGRTFRDKVYPVRALVLGTSDMSRFVSTAKPDATIDFAGQPAAQIHLPKEAWDILVLEFKDMKSMVPSSCAH